MPKIKLPRLPEHFSEPMCYVIFRWFEVPDHEIAKWTFEAAFDSDYDADQHLKFLKRLYPDYIYQIHPKQYRVMGVTDGEVV